MMRLAETVSRYRSRFLIMASISLVSNGHFKARKPIRLIILPFPSRFSFFSSFAFRSASCEKQPPRPLCKDCDVWSLALSGPSRSFFAPSRTAFKLLSSPCRRLISGFAFLTALKYSEQSDATDPDIWITAIMLAAVESPSIASLKCGNEIDERTVSGKITSPGKLEWASSIGDCRQVFGAERWS